MKARIQPEGALEPEDVWVSEPLWMVVGIRHAVPNLVYAAPATSPAQAYRNAGAALGEPPLTADDIKKRGYRAKRVRITFGRKDVP